MRRAELTIGSGVLGPDAQPEQPRAHLRGARLDASLQRAPAALHGAAATELIAGAPCLHVHRDAHRRARADLEPHLALDCLLPALMQLAGDLELVHPLVLAPELPLDHVEEAH